MFDHLRKDFERHGRSLRNRAVWHLAVYRFGRWSLGLRWGPARWLTGKLYGLLSDLSELLTGITMSRTVEVGEGFHVIHAATIFIHPRVRIGARCGIMHNVTIGTNMDARVPVIGDDVFIGCGASVLGAVKVGDHVRIAANSLVINDVPPHSFCVGVPAKTYRRLTGGKRPTAAAEPPKGELEPGASPGRQETDPRRDEEAGRRDAPPPRRASDA